MSSSRRLGRRLPAAALALALAACGFKPLYMKEAHDPGVAADLSSIRVLNVRANAPEHDRLSQQMHNLLLQRLNPEGAPARPLYRLQTSIAVTKERTGIQITEEATRARLTVAANFSLYDAGSNKVIFSGSELSTNSYNIADSQFATLNAESDAARRAVREISESIRIRLGLYFQSQESS